MHSEISHLLILAQRGQSLLRGGGVGRGILKGKGVVWVNKRAFGKTWADLADPPPPPLLKNNPWGVGAVAPN